MKYVVLIIDGAAGWPADELGGRTSLEAASIPNLDRLVSEGELGLARTVPSGMEASSAIACMSVLGFDPSLYYAGRGPIEALSLGVNLHAGEAALRCNLVSIVEGRMASYSAGHIGSAEAHELIKALDDELGGGRVSFHPGLGFRHILTIREGEDVVATRCTPPHDIHDQPVDDHLPRGPGAPLLIELMERSRDVLSAHTVNRERQARGELPANQVWLFWPGLQAVRMPSFRQAHGVTAALTSAVDLLKGLARQAGIDFLDIPGVTDGGDNDWPGQMQGALASLATHDLVFVHVEAPDEAGHSGDAEAKTRAIEKIDELMVPPVMEMGGVRLLVLPDHPTPLRLRTHVDEPVPYLLWGPGMAANGATAYTEKEARDRGVLVDPGHLLVSRLLGDRRIDTG